MEMKICLNIPQFDPCFFLQLEKDCSDPGPDPNIKPIKFSFPSSYDISYNKCETIKCQKTNLCQIAGVYTRPPWYEL